MTSTKLRTRNNNGETVTVHHCPSWCEDHATYLDESKGLLEDDDIRTHRSIPHEGHLHEIRFGNGHIARDGGGIWMLEVHRTELAKGFYTAPALVSLAVINDGLGENSRTFIELTSGDVRVLAAQLVAMADKIDMSRESRG
jgi:hypothetical protein